MRIQEIIHKLEVDDNGVGLVRWTLLIFSFLALAVLVNMREGRSFSSSEAMEVSQLARNIADGKGYISHVVRPLDIYLLQTRNPFEADDPGKAARLYGDHPDLENPPLYPLLLAGWMKLMPFDYEIVDQEGFRVYQPEIWIAIFNQLWFLLLLGMVYRLACRLFDGTVAMMSILALGTTWVLWDFSRSGLTTSLVILLFFSFLYASTILFGCRDRALLPSEEGEAVFPEDNAYGEPALESLGWHLKWSCLVGGILGCLFLTRYACGWLLLPTLIIGLSVCRGRRLMVPAVILLSFALLAGPWMWRNYNLTGYPAGTASFALIEASEIFPENEFKTTLTPNLTLITSEEIKAKFMENLEELLPQSVALISGHWVGFLFIACWLFPFNDIRIRRLRTLAVSAFGTLLIVQAFGETHVSEIARGFTHENLLSLMIPVTVVFGLAVSAVIVDQIKLPFREAGTWIWIGLLVVGAIPFLIKIMPPRTIPIAYPPYYPPIIQERAYWLRPDELLVSDIPAAVGWYGNRTCIELPGKVDEFIEINNQLRPINALYLTQVTMEGALSTKVLNDREGWGWFVAGVLLSEGQMPDGFPVTNAPEGNMTEQMFLTDLVRWGNKQ